LCGVLGRGSFGQVFEAYDLKEDRVVAIKVDAPTKNRRPKFTREKGILDHLTRCECETVPKVYDYGKQWNITTSTAGIQGYTVMSKEGPSLGDVLHRMGKIPLKSILWIAEQIILGYEDVHRTEVLHRDAKPQNFVISLSRPNTVLIIDFGLAIYYTDEHGVHDAIETGRKPVGTARYASLNVHRGLSQSRRDDLESMGFVLVYLLKGVLPWQGSGVKMVPPKYTDKWDTIGYVKQHTPFRKLLKGCPAKTTFLEFFNYVRNLRFDQKPDYAYLTGIFSKRFESEGFKRDYILSPDQFPEIYTKQERRAYRTKKK